MSSFAGPKHVTDSLIFHYDMGDPESFVGAPTTNWMNLSTGFSAMANTTYVAYVANNEGSWANNHSDAVIGYMDNGTQVSGFVNSGVGNWANTYHGVWVVDKQLRYHPGQKVADQWDGGTSGWDREKWRGSCVVKLKDYDAGQWKAMSGVLSIPVPNTILSVGSQYVISWDQWIDTPGKYLNVGWYCKKTADSSYNFWDGLSANSATSRNTALYKWERVYHVYTVSADHKLDDAYCGIYMYGQDGPHNSIIKVANPQFEWVPYCTPYHRSSTPRGTTDALKDLSKKGTLTVKNLTYYSNNTFRFDAANSANVLSTLDAVTEIPAQSDFALECWVRIPEYPTSDATKKQGVLLGAMYYGGAALYWEGNTGGTAFTVRATLRATTIYTTSAYSCGLNTWYHFVMVNDYTNGNKVRLYVNGELHSSSASGPSSAYTNITTSYKLGVNQPQIEGGGTETYTYFTGWVPIAKIYKKALNAYDVKRNYLAHKARFGL